MIGDKQPAEAAGFCGPWASETVGERNKRGKAGLKRPCGAFASENADTSSDKPDGNSGRRKPKVSWGQGRPPRVSRRLS